jgi:hypothetical protein
MDIHMISGGDFAVFLVAVGIVVSFLVILRRLLARAERETDSHADGHSDH